jgi:hypothetical protein
MDGIRGTGEFNMTHESTRARFQFHRYCDYCRERCEVNSPPTSTYVMVTNVWNEREKVEAAFHRMELQSVKPLKWLWIDDGSADGTYEEILRVSNRHPDIGVLIKRMPIKSKGNLNTIGRAYSRHMPEFIQELCNQHVDYYTIQDVGTRPCPNYYARIMELMDDHPEVGACSGISVGEESARESGMPMGDCKVTRWNLIKRIKRYWDLSPDTYINIKILSFGYKLKIWRVPVLQDSRSFAMTKKGMFYQGRLNYFVGRPFLGVLLRAIRRVILRRNGTSMLRGYFQEALFGKWRCDDSEVLSFYGHGKPPLWSIKELLSTGGRYSD